ncbi:hypothetical protein P4V41_08000 [Fictibacillus nanhaiensis]|uniref:hypothetical protein n=1 Tax=Fictibacillus nanhaiensis TaxID=742169 RepID=UPI002E24ACF4|nr:hypothetical protein [Fictibacillus nanhaiensis]
MNKLNKLNTKEVKDTHELLSHIEDEIRKVEQNVKKFEPGSMNCSYEYGKLTAFVSMFWIIHKMIEEEEK